MAPQANQSSSDISATVRPRLCDHSPRARACDAADDATEELMFRRRDRREDPEGSESQADAPVEEAELEDAEQGQAEPGDLPEDMTADLDSQAADYLADNDAWMYGPNADAVLEILDRLEEIDPDDARPLVEAWQEIPKSDPVQGRQAG